MAHKAAVAILDRRQFSLSHALPALNFPTLNQRWRTMIARSPFQVVISVCGKFPVDFARS
jgi:hypothetical protein